MGFRTLGLELWFHNFGLGFQARASGLGVWKLGFRVWGRGPERRHSRGFKGVGFGISSLGFGV